MKENAGTLRILDQLPLEPIRGAIGLSGLLFFGITGEGKTTAVNNIAGIDYRQEKIQHKVNLVPNKVEYFKTGHATTSETRYPQLVKFSSSSVLVDLPGFEDTRGTIEEIAAATSVQILTQQLAFIQAVLMVCSWGNLTDSRMVSYRKVASSVGAIIQLNTLTRENVILLVTKPPSDLEQSEVREKLQRLADDEKWSSCSSTPVKRGEVSDDVWEKHCIRIGTEAILSNQDNGIIILDVTTPRSREEFKQKLKLLKSKRKNTNLFDFGHYSRFMNVFQDEIDTLSESYNQKREERVVLIDDIEKSQSTIKDLVARMRAIRNEQDCRDSSQLTAAVFNDVEYVVYMACLRQKIVGLQQSRLVSKDQKNHWECDARDAERKLAALECREEKSGSYEKTIQTITLSSSIFREEDFAIKPFIEYFECDNKVPISRCEKPNDNQNDLSNPLQFLRSLISFRRSQKAAAPSKLEGIIELTGEAVKAWKARCDNVPAFCQSLRPYNGLPFSLRYPLEFYSYCRDMPQYQGEFHSLRQRISNAESGIKASQDNIWHTDDAIREQERLLYEATEKLNHAKFFHAKKIEISSKQEYGEFSVELDLLKSRLEAARTIEEKSKEMLPVLQIWFEEREVLFRKLYVLVRAVPSLKTDKTNFFSITYESHSSLRVAIANKNKAPSITHPESEISAMDVRETNVLQVG